MRKTWGIVLAATVPVWASNYGDLGSVLLGILLIGLSVPAFVTAFVCSACFHRGVAAFFFSWIAGTLVAFAGLFAIPPLGMLVSSNFSLAAVYSSVITLILFLLHPKPAPRDLSL